MWIGLYAGEVMLAAEYWLARIVQRPLLAIGAVGAGALASFIALAAMPPYCPQTRIAALEVKAMMNGVEVYRSATGAAPARLEDLVPNYVRDLHPDPWGNNYVFYRGAGGVAIVSAGPDGLLGTPDDILTTSPK
jgi:hypothetical protein